METRASHILIGTFTLLVAACSLLFALWIGKSTLDREWDRYDIVFGEAVTGLSIGGAVQYNGIQVGEVRKLSLDPVDPRRVLVHVRMTGGTPVKADTRAKLTFTGLTGVAIIQLSGGTPEAPSLVAKEGQPWPLIIADYSDLQKLMSSGGDIVAKANTVVERLAALLEQRNLDRVSATLENLERISATIAARDDEIGKLIGDVGAAGSELRVALQRSQALFARLDRLAVRAEPLLEKQAPETLEAARQALELVQRAAATTDLMLVENRAALNSFSRQGLAQAGPTLAELRAATRALQQLADTLNRDPAGLLLGHEHPKEYDLP